MTRSESADLGPGELSLTDPHHPRWRQGRIVSCVGKERFGYLTFTVLWNAVGQPAFWLTALRQPGVQWWVLALMAVFPLMGLVLAWGTAVKWLQWHRFGELQLVMDPFPGVSGGDVGGSVELPNTCHAGESVEVTLSCVNLRVSGSGQNRSHHEHVLWRARTVAPIMPGVNGSRIHFRFAVPADQPPTSDPSDDCIQWLVRVHRSLPGADLDQTFELPVLTTVTPLQSRHIRDYSVAAGDDAEASATQILVQRDAAGLHLRYAASRTRGLGLTTVISGVLLMLVSGFLITRSTSVGSGAFGALWSAAGGLSAVALGLVAVLLIGFGAYSLFNTLEVRASAQGISSTRRVLGLRFERNLPQANLNHLRYRIDAQQGEGATATVYYRLEAVPVTGKALCLGDGIKGNPLARRLMRELGDVIGAGEWRQAEGRHRRHRDAHIAERKKT